MRRGLIRYLATGMLAVGMLVQVFAPVGAFRAVAEAVADPLFAAVICHDAGAAQDATTTTPHEGGRCCAICGIGIGAATLVDPPPSIFAVLQLEHRRIVWRNAIGLLPIRYETAAAQARAPPVNT